MKYYKILVIILLIIILSFIIYKKNNTKYATQIPVLIYHHFYSDDDKEKYEKEKDYSVRESAFDKQMKYLHDNGYKSLSAEKFLCWKKKECKIPEKSFLITIDDGQKSVLKYAAPILKKYNFKAISFVITSRINDFATEYDPSKYQYLSKEELVKNDVIIWGSHSHKMHEMKDGKKILYSMNYEQIKEDLKLSKEILNTKYFACPFNTYNNDLIHALEENGYELGFRGQSRKTTQSENRFMNSRIFVSEDFEKFKEIFETTKYDQEV